MAILQQSNAVFYHPLDTDIEFLQTVAWGGPLDQGPGKVALAAVVASEVVDPPTTFGAQSEFLSAGAVAEMSVVAVDSTTVVVAYQDNADAEHGTAKLGTVSGSDITWGSETEFRSAAIRRVSVDALDATHVVVCYSWLSGAACRIGQVVGTTVAFGAEHASPEGATFVNFVVAVAMSPSSFVWVYIVGNSPAKAVVGTVSGTDITLGASVPFSGGVTHVSLGAVKIATDRVAYAFGHTPFAGTTSGFTGGVLSVSGSTLTVLATGQLRTGSTTGPTPDSVILVRMGDDRFVALFRYQVPGASSGAVATACVWDGSLNIGPLCQVNNSAIGGFQPRALVALDSERFMALGDNGDASVHKTAGTQVFAGTTAVFNVSPNPRSDATLLAPGRLVIVFEDGSDFSHGTAVVADVTSRPWIAGSGVPYPTAVGATRLAFSSWHKGPSADPTPEQPTFGLDTEFLSADGVDAMSIAALDATHVIVAYRDRSSSDHGIARVGQVVASVIAWGPATTFRAAASSIVGVARIDASRAVVVYQNLSAAGVWARVGVVSGTSLVFAAEATVSGDQAISVAAGVFSDGRVMAAWHTDDNFIKLRSGSLDGSNTIIFAAEYVAVNAFSSVINGGFTATVFGSDRVAVAWGENASGSAIGIHQHVAGAFSSVTVMSLGAFPTPLQIRDSYSIAGALGDPGFMLSYRGPQQGGGSQPMLTAQAFRMSGTTLLAGRACERRVTGGHNGVAKLDADTYVIMDSNSGGANGQATTVRVTPGLGIAMAEPATFAGNIGGGHDGDVTTLGAGAFVVAYRDLSDFNHGTAKVGSISLPAAVTTTIPPTTTTAPPLVGSITYGSAVQTTIDAQEHIGPSITRFDSTRLVLCYQKRGVTGAWARVATVSGSDITLGAETGYGSGTSVDAWGGGTSVTTVDGTRVVAAMAVTSATFCSVGTVSGTDITFGAAVPSGSNSEAAAGVAGHNAISVVHMDLGKVVVFHAGTASDVGAVRVGTVAGTDITFGASVGGIAETRGDLEVIRLSSTRFVLIGHNDNNSLNARVGVLSGTTVSFPAASESVSGSWVLQVGDHAGVRVGSPFAAAALNATEFLVCWHDNNPSDAPVRARVCTADAGTHIITLGAETLPLGLSSAFSSEAVAIAVLDATTVALCMQLNVPSGSGVAKIGNIVAGPTVSWLPGTGLNDSFEFVSGAVGFGRMLEVAEAGVSKFVPFWIHFASPGDDHGSVTVGTVVL